MKKKQIKNERILYLKKMKGLANKYLDENKIAKSVAKGWKLNVVENNIYQLKERIKDLNKSLGEQSLKEHVEFEIEAENYQNGMSREMTFDSLKHGKKVQEALLFYKLLRFSVSYSIEHDLYWINDGTLDDQVAIATGRKSPEILGDFLKSKREKTENETLQYLKNDEKYKTVTGVFETAINESKRNSYLTSNILLITGIESLVRLLARFVYKNQNPDLSEDEVENYIFKKFLSLEGLISKGKWNEDLFIKLSEATRMNEYIFDESIQKADDVKRKHIEGQVILNKKFGELAEYLNLLINDDNYGEVGRAEALAKLDDMQKIAKENIINYNEENIGISLKTKLQFLLRTYKEDRNQLIHGNFSTFNKKWKNYIYFSALQKVFELVKMYNEKY